MTQVFPQRDEFSLPSGSVYLYGASSEARSHLPPEWQGRFGDVAFSSIQERDDGFSFAVEGAHWHGNVRLRSGRDLEEFSHAMPRVPIYLDVTGLGSHAWAPILRTFLSDGHSLSVVYAEPADYRFSDSPTDGQIFDLSERIRGIAPMPGLTRLVEPKDEEHVCFVPLLGFEGTRFAYVLEQLQPSDEKIIPVIGVPGFRPEYPFYTYLSNQAVLIRTKAWRRVRFASANCPFSIYWLLRDISAAHPGDFLKIAIIGTKPHALGAILFAIKTTTQVELVYDYPIAKEGRTAGTGRVLVYDVGSLDT